MKVRWRDNFSYKLVALGVATVLWMSMLGKKDASVVREFELQTILPPNTELETTLPDFVRVEIAGPRVALKKLNQMNPVFSVDLTNFKPGRQFIELSREGLNLPIGARVISIEPKEFVVVLRGSKIPKEGP